jgi:hypothetical protein
MKPKLHTVEPVFDEKKSRKRIADLREKLLAEAVRFVVEGATAATGNSRPERAKEASDLSGIPRTLIESRVRG